MCQIPIRQGEKLKPQHGFRQELNKPTPFPCQRLLPLSLGSSCFWSLIPPGDKLESMRFMGKVPTRKRSSSIPSSTNPCYALIHVPTTSWRIFHSCIWLITIMSSVPQRGPPDLTEWKRLTLVALSGCGGFRYNFHTGGGCLA